MRGVNQITSSSKVSSPDSCMMVKKFRSQPPSVVPNPAPSLPRAHNDTMLVGINWISKYPFLQPTFLKRSACSTLLSPYRHTFAMESRSVYNVSRRKVYTPSYVYDGASQLSSVSSDTFGTSDEYAGCWSWWNGLWHCLRCW